MTNVIGFLATFLSAFTSPSQVINVIKSRNNAEVLNGVSVWSIFLIMSTSAVWFTYGLSFGAIWTSVIAMIDVVVYVTISIVVGVYGGRRGILLVALSSFFSLMVVALSLGQLHMGVVGSILSSIMFVPQAMKIYHMRGTPGIYSFSLLSSILIIVSSVMWIWYAFLLQDVWVGAPSPLAIIAGIAMIVVRLQGVDESKI